MKSVFELPPTVMDLIEDSIITIPTSLADTMQEITRPYTESVEPFRELLRPILEMAESLAEAQRPFKAMRMLGEVQYVYWDYLMPEFVDSIISAKSPRGINKFLLEWNKADGYRTLGHTNHLCSLYLHNKPYERLFIQSIAAFHNRNNELAVVGFIVIVDGLLADISGKDTTNWGKRIEALIEKCDSLDEDDAVLFILLSTLEGALEVLRADSRNFKNEPQNLNRHLIMHGRSRRIKRRLDCIKLINIIYGLLLTNDYIEQDADVS